MPVTKDCRSAFLEQVIHEIGFRKLIWLGTRSHDAEALLEIPQFSRVFGVAAPLGAVSLRPEVTLEQLTGRRENLDTYTLDQDGSPEAAELRRRLYEALAEPACLASYRPLTLISAVTFPRSSAVRYLGMFHERQSAFEHKPWVETELRRAGVCTIPWTYFVDHGQERLNEELECRGALVLRANRSDGGTGLTTVFKASEIAARLPSHQDGFIGAAPLLVPHVPLNVTGCIFPNGQITLHAPSIQLIGLPTCTSKPFGYCGNDFSAVRDLDERILDRFEREARLAGRWLASQGYLGAFGVDALVHEGRVYVAEINPRFQGSSLVGARLDRSMGRPDAFLCHLGAFLGLKPPRQEETLAMLAKTQPEAAQIIVHNRATHPVSLRSAQVRSSRLNAEIQPADSVTVEPEAILLRALSKRKITENGWELHEGLDNELNMLLRDPNP